MNARDWWNSLNVPYSKKFFNGLFKEIQEAPRCDFCGKQIDDGFFYRINGESVCKCCLDRHFREDVIPYE